MEAGIPIWWISVLLPILVGLLALTRRGEAKLIGWASAISLLIPGAAVFAYWLKSDIKAGVVDPLVIDLSRHGIGKFYMLVDGLSAPIVVGISIVSGLVAIYSLKYMLTRIEEMVDEGETPPSMGAYYFLYNLFAASMLGMAFSSNLIEFFVFLELSLVSSFLLIAYYGYGDRRKISLLYFIWTHVAGALFLVGVLYYGIHAGSFDVVKVTPTEITYVAPAYTILAAGAKLAAALIIIGLFIKMAVVGVHMWLPYAHAEAPTPISALLSPNLIGIAGYALVRFALPLFPDVFVSLRDYLVALGLATIIYGGLVALKQTDFKRLLAYSSVSQMGYLLLGIATLTAYGIGGAMLHYLSHAFGKAVLFMTAGVFITELHGLRDITRMGGLARAYPLTAAAALLGFMHLVGMPPSLGMWSEILITLGVVKAYAGATTGQLVVLAIALIIAFTISAAYAFITMRRIFYGQLSSASEKLGVKPGFEVLDTFKAIVVLVAIIGVFYFIAITPVMDSLKPASEVIVSLLG